MRPDKPLDNSVVVIDTDVGFDDVMAIAMLLAANAPIAGLTTVNGLAHARPGAENVLRLLQRVGCRDIPVAVGAAAPLSGDRAFVSSWRDKADALAEITLPPTDLEPVSSSAAEFLVHTVNERPSQVALLCLGPLTNVALALQLAGERFVQQVGKIVMMGGAVRVPGNDTPNDVSEWNLYVDPLAAAQTVHSGIPITMIGLDVTNAAPCTPQLVQAMCERRPQSPAARVMQETMQGMYDYLYDQVAAAYLLDPAIVQTARLPIQVVDTGPHVGQTVETSSGTPIDVALTLDQRRFHQLLLRLVGEA